MSIRLPDTDAISAAELQALLHDRPDVRILDVRTGPEFETVHIPGSFNVPLDTLGEHVADLADVSHPVVLVCRSGARASTAHGQLAAAGKDRLHVLDGGIGGWQAAGGEVRHGDTSRWAMDRQVRLVAGALGLGAVAAGAAWYPATFLAGAVGAGLVYSAVSNSCAMANLLARLPYNRTDRCDIDRVLAELAADLATTKETSS
ncbi:MAG: rhodanese-like domain-containing protein [Actinomycetota bacterium]